MDEARRGGLFRRVAWAACLATAATIGAEARAGGYSGLVVFGDSLSDGGNVAAMVTAAGAPFPYHVYSEGKFTNGKVWVDYLAESLGLEAPKASLLGGSNYAHAYAQSGAGYSTPVELGGMPIANLLTQVQSFEGSLGGGSMDSNKLISIWAGANDILHGGISDLAGIQAAVGNVITAAQSLYDLGGRHFLIGGVPYLGGIPAVANQPRAVKDGLNQIAATFNAVLAGAMAEFRATRADARVTYSDANTTFEAILANPSAFGLTNLTDQAAVAISMGGDPNPDHYLYWDDVHPTTAVHRLIAEAAFRAVVPEPSSIVLAAIGGLGIVAAARRRAA
ncbi:SGNH/GDSL hydrolase family protein [Paludisphaera sp.]|uniref:SGNH/GDSL hydrolase family protein n=1 Tax=Paludisphaera sp. TaxID=2017432 RepID=UPI00301DAC79